MILRLAVTQAEMSQLPESNPYSIGSVCLRTFSIMLEIVMFVRNASSIKLLLLVFYNCYQFPIGFEMILAWTSLKGSLTLMANK